MEEVLSWLRKTGYNKHLSWQEEGPKDHAENVVWRLERHSDLMKALTDMVKNGNEPTYLSFEEFTYDDLRKMFGMKPVGALLLIAWLREEPSEARESMKSQRR